MADAEAAGRRLLVLQPSDTSSREKLALAILAQGREDEAIAEMEAVIAENPASLIAYRTHGDILLRRGDVSGALSRLEKALLLHDEDPRFYLEVVELCVRNEKLDRAVWWLGQARSRYDRLPELPLYEGQILGHLKRWREALNAFNTAAELAAQHQSSLLTADFHFQHGVMAERSGEHDAAARHFRACLERDPSHAAAMNYLGYMWAERGENLAEAEKLIRRAVEMEPDNAAYLDSLGWVLYQQGRFHEAIVPLEQAAKLSEDAADATIEEHLGDVLDKLGRRNEAVKAWERAASLGGGSAGLAAKLQAARGAPAAETASGSKARQP
jgi:tetratricopeptide (TPR) repeat protein